MKDQIIHDDSINHMSTMDDESIDLVVTDPPYLMDYKTGRRKNKSHDFCTAIDGDSDPQLITDYIKECHRILKDNTAMYMFCNANKIDFFKSEIEENGFIIKNIIVWDKGTHSAGDLAHAFGKRHEFIILANKGSSKIRGARLQDIWNFPRVAGNNQLHQNQKPVKLIEQCIIKHSDPGDLIFDGFVGSGTTAMAALNQNRHYYCIEKEIKYFNIAMNRLQQGSSSLLEF